METVSLQYGHQITRMEQSLFFYSSFIIILRLFPVFYLCNNSDITHEPPHTIVMKQQKWFVADNMKTQLLNADGEEVAATERVKHQISSYAARHREGLGGDTNGNNSSVSVNFYINLMSSNELNNSN